MLSWTSHSEPAVSHDALYGAYRRTVAPTLWPVTLPEVKAVLDISCDDDSQNDRLKVLIPQIVDMIERDSHRVIMTQTWQWFVDRFPCGAIELRMVPIQSLTFLKYITGGTPTTWASSNYQTDLVSEPARVLPVLGQYWPVADCALNAVQLEWLAGYASAALVPPLIKNVVLQAIKLDYHNCEFGDGYWALIERLRTFGFVS